MYTRDNHYLCVCVWRGCVCAAVLLVAQILLSCLMCVLVYIHVQYAVDAWSVIPWVGS